MFMGPIAKALVQIFKYIEGYRELGIMTSKISYGRTPPI
jgi:hypothetical protein